MQFFLCSFLVAFLSSAAALKDNGTPILLSTGSNINPTTSIWSSGDTPTATSVTTYTTTTDYPITRTQSTGSLYSIYTTLTTSTITITSCVGGCLQPTSTGFVPYPISNSSAFPDVGGPSSLPSVGTVGSLQGFPAGTGLLANIFPSGIGTAPSSSIPTIMSPSSAQAMTTTGSVESATIMTSVGTTTIQSTVATFIPQSSLVGISGTSSYYSTYLSLSYSSTSTISTTTSYEVVLPTASSAAEPNAIAAATSTPSDNCPQAQTIYSTVYVTVTTGTGQPSTPSSFAEALGAAISDSSPFGSGASTGQLPFRTGTASTYASSGMVTGTGTGTGNLGMPTPSANGTYLGSALARRWLSPLF